jgi:enamine deaminase RidA (YjgF/YER057c/UK114 family)
MVGNAAGLPFFSEYVTVIILNVAFCSAVSLGDRFIEVDLVENVKLIGMTDRVKFSSGTKWESIVGYSRAIRVGKVVHVSGTTATDAEGKLVGFGDAAAQTIQALNNLRRALESVGAKLEDVVRTRIYVTDMSRWEEIGKAHGSFFSLIRPATTMVEVKNLVSPEMLVEIEAEAILD